MKKTEKLSGAQREFCALVDRAAFCNPFSAERRSLNLQLGGADPKASEADVVRSAIEAVKNQVERLDREGLGDLRRFTGEDRRLLHSVFLFAIFHRFIADFDRLIVRQVAGGDLPVAVPFAAEALQVFHRRGFPPEEARRYFAFFFQMRRAFYFITGHLKGASPSMRELRLRLWNNLFTHRIAWYERYLWDRMEDFSTLLLGETGTGKGAAAAAIGRSGFIPFDEGKERFAESFTRSFVAINLSQFPETLIESELFGHRKGAFTGAVGDRPGIFARCSPHGAIFLDEIGDVSPPVQIKLLQVLQERTFTPLGSHQAQRFQGRVIAATHRPLDRLRREGVFRDDFYYRLCSDVIAVPTLRQRLEEDPEELGVLLQGVVQRTIGEESPSLASQIREHLDKEPGRGYAWPGNVRELEQAARRILLTGRFAGEEGAGAGADDFLARISSGELDAQQLLAGYCGRLYRRLGTYEEVARVTGLDRRTVKKHVLAERGAA